MSIFVRRGRFCIASPKIDFLRDDLPEVYGESRRMPELRAKGSVCYGEDPEGEKLEYSGGGGAWEFIEGDGRESGYGEGSGDLSSADWDSGAGICEYSGGEGIGSIYSEGKD